MGALIEFCVFIFLTTVTGVLGGDFCVYRNIFQSSTTRWCTNGCCDTDCCDYPKLTVKSFNVALIVGLSVTGILVVCTIIAVVCCCVRRRGARGQVIHTNPGGPNVVVATAQTSNMMSPSQPGYPTAGYQPGVYGPPQAYPMGHQPYPPTAYGGPAPQPAAGVMAPPAYNQVAGGQNNAGFDYKPIQ